MLRRIPIIALAAGLTVFSLALAAPAAAENRGLLWRVVQACILNHSLTGTAFPCLAVETKAGVGRGYAVVREPGDRTRLVVVPTVATSGIEARRLRGADAPNYFQDAWASRRFVATDGTSAAPSRGDLALAINSHSGRSQDQLHIHVACIRADVKRTILAQRRRIRGDRWTQIRAFPRFFPYTARFVPGADLAGINVFDEAAKALKVDARGMEHVTIVVLGTEADTTRAAAPAGFILMVRQRRDEDDHPHGEALLDPSCKSLRGPRA